MNQIIKLYRLLIAAASSLQSVFLLAIRLYWGWQFIQTGWGHLMNLDSLTKYFTELGIPAPALNSHLIATLEFGGGILLALGLGSRLIALLLTGNMFMAYITADREALFSIFSDPDKLYRAAPYTFLFASLLILIFGPGKFCIDTLLEKRFAGPDKASLSQPA